MISISLSHATPGGGGGSSAQVSHFAQTLLLARPCHSIARDAYRETSGAVPTMIGQPTRHSV